MKRSITIIALILAFLATDKMFSQVATDAWSLGFGGTYPRFQSTDVRPKDANYGGYLSIARHFTEHMALRLRGNYLHMVGELPTQIPTPHNWTNATRYQLPNGTNAPFTTEVSTDIIAGNLDMLYYFDPCGSVSPYLQFGIGAAYFQPDWGNVVNPDVDDKLSAQVSIGLGATWTLSENWKLDTDFMYSSLDGAFDGIVNQNRRGIFGSSADAYIALNVGFQYYFGKGEPSKYCQLYEGLKPELPDNLATVEDVERIVKENIPKEVIKQVVVEKEVPVKRPKEDWILFGVNFEFDKSALAPEAIPILEHAVKVLKDNSDLRIEIQGHTDYIGSESYNQKLSEKRANTVKDYLVEHGISASRLSTQGFGESQPIASNKTVFGRAQNRRVEFKILNSGMKNEARD